MSEQEDGKEEEGEEGEKDGKEEGEKEEADLQSPKPPSTTTR